MKILTPDNKEYKFSPMPIGFWRLYLGEVNYDDENIILVSDMPEIEAYPYAENPESIILTRYKTIEQLIAAAKENNYKLIFMMNSKVEIIN